MSDDNDDLEAAMDAPDDAPPQASDDRDPSDAFEASADAWSGRPVPGRSVSDKTRALFKAAAAALKPQLGDYGGDEEPALDAPTDPGEPASAPAGPAGRATPTPVAQTTPPAGAPISPPAPSLDPAVQQERQRLADARSELEKREAAFRERERSGDIAQLGDKYFADPEAAVVELLKQWTGAATDEEVNREVGDLMTRLGQRLGLPLNNDTKEKLAERLELKRVRREVRASNAREQALERQATERAAKAQREQAARVIGSELAKDDHRKTFPWLAAEENAGDLIIDVYDHALRTENKQIHWTEAAKRAEEHLQRQGNAWLERRKHLSPQAAPQAKPVSTPGAAPGNAARAVVSNKAASETRAPASTNPAVVDGKFNMEAHRAQTKRKLRAALAASNAPQE